MTDGPGIAPSNSTIASVGIGIPAATIISWLWNGIASVKFPELVMPGPVEAAIGAIISAGVGYFFHGGKANDTQ